MKKVNQLTDRQRKEFEWILGQEYLRLESGEISVEKAVDQIRQEYKAAIRILDDKGPEALKKYRSDAAGEKRAEWKDGVFKTNIKPNPKDFNRTRAKVAEYVLWFEFNPPIYERKPPFEGKLSIFKIGSNVGNPDYISTVEADKVAKIAQSLIDRNSWRRYVLKRISQGVMYQYPNVLLDDCVEELKKEGIEVNRSTVRRKLKEEKFLLPLKCRHRRR